MLAVGGQKVPPIAFYSDGATPDSIHLSSLAIMAGPKDRAIEYTSRQLLKGKCVGHCRF
jgi:hypothetical protein